MLNKLTGRRLLVVLFPLMAFMTMLPAQANNAAIHIDNGGCGLFDGNGGVALADTDHSVVTSSGNGVIVCKVQVAPPSSGKAVRYDFANTGLPCGVPNGGLTTDWKETVSADGSATLSCHVRSSSS